MVSSWLLLLRTALALAGAPEDEKLYLDFRARLAHPDARFQLHPSAMPARDLRLALDAVEDTLLAGHSLPLSSLLPGHEWRDLPAAEQARWFRLGGVPSEEALAESVRAQPWSAALLYELLRQRRAFRTHAARQLAADVSRAFPAETAHFRALKKKTFTPPAASEVRALWAEKPPIETFQNGAFAAKPRLFLFCRHNRRYPCLLAMRDQAGQPVRDGAKLWTQPGLGLSGYGKPFNERLGNTPSGVHLVRGVMPEASDTLSYGKFRRMILEFAPASAGEAEQKKLLPAAVHGSEWWREAAIARDVGRGELRIHGTGHLNDQPKLEFYPFIATIGCVAQRELKYGNTTYVDQRLLLDRVMRAQGLEAKFANEPAIRALLYVIDIDEKNAPVTSADLARYGAE